MQFMEKIMQMKKVAKSLGDAYEDVELAIENDISYDDSYNMSLPAPSNVMPPSSQAVKTQLILDSLVKIKQKNLDKFLTLVSWLKCLR